MRILILHNKIKQNSYADFLLKLLLQALTTQNYKVIKTNGFSQAEKINLPELNVVILIEVNNRYAHLFSRLQLYFFVKKQDIKWLVQAADNKIVSSGLEQLIISNNAEKFINVKKPLLFSLAVCSHIARQKIIDINTNLSEDNIKIFPAAANSMFQPLSWSEQQSVKMQYTQGREYFFVVADGKTFDSFMALLKAFSTFKKWQQSSMKLVISGKLHFTQTKEWSEKISTYKYRDDIVITNEQNDNEYATLLAGAYAFIHTPVRDNSVLPMLQSMQCETPCISFITDSTKEYADAAAILLDPNDYDKLSEKLILLYKDETLRSSLIEKGKLQAKLYANEKAIEAITNALPLHLH